MHKAAATLKLEIHRLSIRMIISPRGRLSGRYSDKVPPLTVKSKPMTLSRLKGRLKGV
jgi:hypothetical protein